MPFGVRFHQLSRIEFRRHECEDRVDSPIWRDGRRVGSHHLFVISRQQPQLYGYVRENFALEPDVEIIIDRRVAGRRQLSQVPRVERRRRDRRSRPEVDEQIQSLGCAFVGSEPLSARGPTELA